MKNAFSSPNFHWHSRSKTHIWHPCTHMPVHEKTPLLPIQKAEGLWLYDYAGNRYLDTISSWWVNLFGHGYPPLVNAIVDQLQKVDHIMLAGLTHEPAIVLAERLCQETQARLGLYATDGKGLGHLHFASDGSSSTEIALKMSAHFWLLENKPDKNQFIALQGGYHGETIGALGVTDIPLFKSQYQPLIRPSFVCPVPQSASSSERSICLQSLERYLINNQASTAALIFEPLIQCANGMRFYDKSWLTEVVSLCKKHQVHVIADEIAVGIGRTGTLFACEQLMIRPDFMCLSKGISGGILPLSLVLTTDSIYQSFMASTARHAFLHSHSYSGNPLACRAAVTTLSLLLDSANPDDQTLLQQISTKGRLIAELLAEQLSPFGDTCQYLRQQGMIVAFDVQHTTPEFSRQFFQEALKHELLIRPIGQTVYVMPPYTINQSEIQHMVEGIGLTLKNILSE